METNLRNDNEGHEKGPATMWSNGMGDEQLDDDDFDDALGEADTDFQQNSAGKSKSAKQDGAASGSQPKRKRPLKLTQSQRERKRAIDREAQRSIRIKTKNYIAHLESMVKAMEQNDTHGPDGENNRTRELMNQLRQSQEEVRRLREAMLGVQRVLGGALGDAARNALNIESNEQRQASSSSSPPSEEADVGVSGSFSATTRPQIENMGAFWIPPQEPNPTGNMTIHSDHTTPPSLHPARPPQDPNLRNYEGEMFYYAEYHLTRVYSAQGPGAFTNRPFDEDIIVRSVIEGWPAVEERYHLDLGWQVLQEIDQVIFPDVGIVERMAAMRLLRMKLLHTVNSRVGIAVPGPQQGLLPGYMTAEVVHHDNRANVVDNFVWPGFRKLLVETPQRYITNEFNESFRHNLKFLWPFEISDSYTKDPVSQLYCSAPEFMRRQADIRCWTMKRVFFSGFEELWENIPAYEAEIRKSLPGPGMISNGGGAVQAQGNVARQGSFGMQRVSPMGMVVEDDVDDDGVEEDLLAAADAAGSGPGPAVVLPSNVNVNVSIPPTGWMGNGGQVMGQHQHPHSHPHASPMSATSMSGGFWGQGLEVGHHGGVVAQGFAGHAGQVQVMAGRGAGHMGGHRGSLGHGFPP